MSASIFTLNAGSSSLKFSCWEVAGSSQLHEKLRGEIQRIGIAPHLAARLPDGSRLLDRDFGESAASLTHEQLLPKVFDLLPEKALSLTAIAHRVVHGGEIFQRPARIDPQTLAAIEALTPLAPLHQPHNLAAVRACARLRPEVAQVACFDTAFHRTIPPVARRFGLPEKYEAQGILRYGFHGISYEYIARRLRKVDAGLADGRSIVAHLGNGASLCAMHGGRSVDTTMSFTPLDGLLMGTRSGALDPGVVTYLMRERGMSGADIEDVLYHQSGLLGVSGISSDMRALLASNDSRAREAIDLFIFRAAREAGALVVSLGGLDGIVFTAGIGEHAPEVRAGICARLGWLGIDLDETANDAGALCVTRPASRVRVYVLPTDEERMLAEHATVLLHDRS
jgi:acetate kinase